MKQQNGSFKSKLLTFLSVLLFLVSIVAIILSFPREGKFRFEYQKGKPWMHDMLITPYNFPIFKTNEEIQLERDSIQQKTQHQFAFNDNVYIDQLKLFQEDYDAKWKEYFSFQKRADSLGQRVIDEAGLEETRTDYLSFYTDILAFVYKKGIISKDVKLPPDAGIIVVRNKTAKEIDSKEVFTLEMAKQYISGELTRVINDSLHEGRAGYDFYEHINLENYIVSNLIYDELATRKLKESLLGEISLTLGMVQEGEKVISKGDVVDNNSFRILESFRKEFESRHGKSKASYLILLGQLILVAAAFLMLFLFLYNFRLDLLQNFRKLLLIILLMVIMVFVGAMAIKTSYISLYIVPFAILPIIIKTFYDSRLALFVHVITILLLGFIIPNAFEFVFVQIIAGMIAIFSLASIKRRGKIFLSVFLVFVTYSIVYMGWVFIQHANEIYQAYVGGNVDAIKLNLQGVDWVNFGWFAGNCLLLLSSYPLIYIFEKVFGFTSELTLMELTDTNHPLLRKLNEQAPGTFQHSLQVANLAEEATYNIGGDPLLARVGAMYHDIGKMGIAEYFIENQGGGINPHDKLDYLESARIIISHITKGMEMARKYKLPKVVADFIPTHQGNNKVTYFYRMYKNANPDVEVDEKAFSYPGPIPYSKETAVVMIADSVEAASRSLKVYSDESINGLIENIVAHQMNEKQFDGADITMKEISTVKETLKKKLKNIYHSRIEYPQEKKEE